MAGWSDSDYEAARSQLGIEVALMCMTTMICVCWIYQHLMQGRTSSCTVLFIKQKIMFLLSVWVSALLYSTTTLVLLSLLNQSQFCNWNIVRLSVSQTLEKMQTCWTDLGLSISKVFVNLRKGEIHAKISHFRGFFYFRWNFMTTQNVRHKIVVLPREELYSIPFVGRTNMAGWPWGQ